MANTANLVHQKSTSGRRSGIAPHEFETLERIGTDNEMVIDCQRGSHAQALNAIRRLRWSGYSGRIVVAGFDGAALDRAILLDSGANEVSPQAPG